MEAEVFPGFIIRRMNPDIQPFMVQQFLHTQLGMSDNELSKLPEITIFKEEDAPHCHVVVKGVKMNFGCIRRKLYSKELMGYFVSELEPDFGIPLNNDGSFQNAHLHDTIHARLMEGKGYLDPLNLLNRSFANEKLGKLSSISNVLLFRGGEGDMRHSKLRDCLVYEMAYLPSQEQNLANSSGLNNHLLLNYLFRLGALQDLCYLNNNPSFARNGHKFFNKFEKVDESGTTHESTLDCEITPMLILGFGTKRINIFKEFKTYGYVRLEILNPQVFDLTIIKAFKSECIECSVPYAIVGVDPDLGWLAGVCDCKPQNSICWNNENFTRLTLKRHELEMFNKHYSPDSHWELVPLLPGACPLYEDVAHFRNCAFKALYFETKYQRDKIMLYYRTTGTIKTVEFKETIMNRGKLQDRIIVVVNVPKDEFWNNDCYFSRVDRVQLIKKEKSPTKTNVYSKTTMSGKVYELENDTSAPNICSITLVLTVASGLKVQVEDCVQVIPKPPISEYLAIKRTLNKWQNVDLAQKRSQLVVGFIEPAQKEYYIHELDVGFNYLEAKIRPQTCLDFKGLESKLDQFYIGFQVTVDAYIHDRLMKLKVDGRVVKIKQVDMEQVLFAILRMPLELEYQPGEVLIEFWGALKTLETGKGWSKSPTKQLGEKIILREWTHDRELNQSIDDEEEDDENENGNFARDEDDAGKYGGYRRKIRSTSSCSTIPDFFKCWAQLTPRIDEDGEFPEAVPFNVERIEHIIIDWQYTPFYPDYQILDFMLDSQDFLDRPPSVYEPCDRYFARFREDICTMMDTYQSEAVDMMISNRISVTVGPPGSGKSFTCAMGIFSLHCLEDGLILVVCPSDEAASNMFRKLKRARHKLDLVQMKIMRMYSEKQEEEDVYQCDVEKLHGAMKTRENWLQDMDMKNLMEKKIKSGSASLFKAELEAYRRHVRQIQADIIMEQDVIVTTLHVCGDGRLEDAVKGLARESRRISGLFIDDANQINMPSIIHALTLNPERVIMVGDDQQLPPFVTSPTGRYAGLDLSWMTLFGLTPHGKKNSIRLKSQYRLPSNICNLVSKISYNGELETKEEIEPDRLSQYQWLDEEIPGLFENRIVCFTYSDSNAESREDGSSFCNMREVEIVKQILERINDAGVSMDQVSVITNYLGQVKKIEQTTDSMELQYQLVEIGTPDVFQGDENDVVILSLVRSNDATNLGLLSDHNRLNVALSRAKHFLVIVADFKLLGRCKWSFIERFMQALREMEITPEEINQDE